MSGQQDGGADAQGGGNDGDQQGGSKRMPLIIIAIIGIAGYACMAFGAFRGQGDTSARGEGPAFLRKLSGVPMEELRLRDADGRAMAWPAEGSCTVPAGSQRILAVADRDTRIGQIRSLGLRFAAAGPVADGEPPAAPAVVITYLVDDPDDPRAKGEIAERIVGKDHAVTIPRERQDGDTDADLLSARLPLLMCAGTLRIENTGDGPVRFEVY